MAMLHKTLRNLRTQHGMTQEELAIHLHVVRQTVAKWEKGLSVPDANTLIAIGQLFETPVSQLLDEDIYFPAQGDTTAILSQQLARENEQLAKNLTRQRYIARVLSILGLVAVSLVALGPLLLKFSA